MQQDRRPRRRRGRSSLIGCSVDTGVSGRTVRQKFVQLDSCAGTGDAGTDLALGCMAVEAGLGGPVASPVGEGSAMGAGCMRLWEEKKSKDVPLAVVDLDAEVKVHDFALELKRSHGSGVCGRGSVGTHTRRWRGGGRARRSGRRRMESE